MKIRKNVEVEVTIAIRQSPDNSYHYETLTKTTKIVVGAMAITAMWAHVNSLIEDARTQINKALTILRADDDEIERLDGTGHE